MIRVETMLAHASQHKAKLLLAAGATSIAVRLALGSEM